MLVSLLFSLSLGALATPVEKRQVPAGVPSYAVKYAPIVYLYTGDGYRPADIASQLVHTQPELNFTLIKNAPKPLTLNNLNQLNNIGDTDVYLTSKQDISQHPLWTTGVTPDNTGKTNGAVSCAIIINDHGGSSLVDVYYMYFYAFNYGGMYVGQQVDDHVGDWEHNMIRFENGKPRSIWYSQHTNGEAFTYGAVHKYTNGLRPIGFSANGSHANYATSGTHGHDIPDVNLPAGLLEDYTDQGPLWDPTLSAYYYNYDNSTGKYTAYDSSTPVNWLYYLGRWGDDQYPTTDPRQECPLGIQALCKYSSGPTGPYDKDLNRTKVCPDNGYLCIVRPILTP